MTSNCIILVVMLSIAYVSNAQVECPDYPNGMDCYECSTHKGHEFCSDPFNSSDPGVEKKLCLGACAKWVRLPSTPDGQIHTIRTCSASLNLNMQVTLVCMRESRPGEGLLCFCKSPDCNHSSQRSRGSFAVLCTALLVGWLISGWAEVGVFDNSCHDYLYDSSSHLKLTDYTGNRRGSSNKAKRQPKEKRKKIMHMRQRLFVGRHSAVIGLRLHTGQRSSQKKTKVI